MRIIFRVSGYQRIQILELGNGLALGFGRLGNRHQVVGEDQLETVRQLADASTAQQADAQSDERTQPEGCDQFGR